MLGLTEQSAARLASLSLERRRTIFYAAWKMSAVLRQAPRLELQDVFQRAIRLPGRHARRLSYQADFHDALSLMEWGATKHRPLAGLIDDISRVTFVNEEALARLAAEKRSLVLAPVHMGAYVFAMATLAYRHFQGRRILILRNHAENESDTLVLNRVKEIGCDVRFMAIKDKASFIDALRFARKDAIIICFVDLPASYGMPVDVELFGRPAKLGMGIDALARACNAVVVPMVAQSGLASETIIIRRPFEIGNDDPRERQRVALLIRQHIEASILEAPAQWHMWPRLSEFLVGNEQSDTTKELAA